MGKKEREELTRRPLNISVEGGTTSREVEGWSKTKFRVYRFVWYPSFFMWVPISLNK